MAVSREEIIEALKEMSLLEASELVKDIEETLWRVRCCSGCRCRCSGCWRCCR